MDDEDVEWLNCFNSKAEGSSGIGGDGSLTSPATNGHANGNGHTSQGRPVRIKGKEREKAETPAPLFIPEDVFEYVMGVLEKHVEDSFPALHTVRLGLSSARVAADLAFTGLISYPSIPFHRTTLFFAPATVFLSK